MKNKVIKTIIINILRIIFLVWFIGSFYLAFKLKQTNTYYGLMVVGQIFLVLGLLILKNAKVISLIAIIPGLLLVIIPYLMLNQNLLPFAVDWKKLLISLSLIIFIIIGLVMMILCNKKLMELKEKCTIIIKAKIVRYDTIRADKTFRYIPYYTYEFNSKIYNVKDVTVGKKQNIDSEVELKIDPLDPESFISIEKENELKSNRLMGTIIFCANLLILVAVVL